MAARTIALRSQAFQLVQLIERFAWGQAVGLDLGERIGKYVRCGFGFGRREQGQIIEACGDAPGRVAAGLELGQH